MSDSVILQVDESTKGLMEEIQSGITFSIEEGVREVKDKVESVDENTDMILRKFKNFDGLSSTVDQLRSLAEDSRKIAEIVSPLQNSVSEIHEGTKSNESQLKKVDDNVSLLIKELVEVGNRQAVISSETKDMIQNVLSRLSKDDEDIQQILVNVHEKQIQVDVNYQDSFSRISSSLEGIKSSICALGISVTDNTKRIEDILVEICTMHTEFEKKYASIESVHANFEYKTISQLQGLNEALEKLQTTLDIVVNLVTPFWKKLIR